jgi:hypothetical protein
MRIVLACLGLVLASGPARAEEVRGEVTLAGADDVAALCTELREADAREAAKIRGALYTMHLPSSAFALLPYDGHRARVAIDAARGFRARDGSYELMLHDLGGATRRDPTLEMAIPASSTEAKTLAKGHHAGTITMTLWFRLAGSDAQVCARVHTATGEGTRLAIEPMAFRVAQGSERLASGETADFGALRDAAAGGEPRVSIAAPVLTRGGKAPEQVARAAAGLESSILGCYRAALKQSGELRGALVIGVETTTDGKVVEAKAEIDGIGDVALVSCALAEARKHKFPGKSARFSIPVKFVRD